jgi:glutathione peroxidase
VNGKDAHPLYKFMKQRTKMGDIRWNYEKFLVDRQGNPRKRFGSLYDPINFEDDVSLALRCIYTQTFSGRYQRALHIAAAF